MLGILFILSGLFSLILGILGAIFIIPLVLVMVGLLELGAGAGLISLKDFGRILAILLAILRLTGGTLALVILVPAIASTSESINLNLLMAVIIMFAPQLLIPVPAGSPEFPLYQMILDTIVMPSCLSTVLLLSQVQIILYLILFSVTPWIILAIVIIWYLTKPEVKGFFM